jgi:hypothetical protein
MVDENVLPEGFGESDPDFMASAYAESKKTTNPEEKSNVVFLKTGVTHCRVLPPHVNAPSWFYEYKEHGLRPEGKFRTFTCPKSVGDNPCPVCEEGQRLYDEKTETSILAAKALYAKRAYLYNVYVYNNPDGKSLRDGIVVLKSVGGISPISNPASTSALSGRDRAVLVLSTVPSRFPPAPTSLRSWLRRDTRLASLRI